MFQTFNDCESEQSVDDDQHNVSLSDFDNTYHSTDDEIPLNMRVQYFLGIDGTKWFCKNNTKIRTITRYEVNEKCGVKNEAKNAKSEIETC